MNKKKFNVFAVVVIIILAMCAIGMVITGNHAHFVEIMNTLAGK